MDRLDVDIAIIGGGIAGASLAYFLGNNLRVALIERENHFGYHATGRSAAVFFPPYGSRLVRMLTRASKAFLMKPPPEVCEESLLTGRGCMFLGRPGQEAALADFHRSVSPEVPSANLCDKQEAIRRVPILRAEMLSGFVDCPDTHDLDAPRLMSGFLKAAKRNGVILLGGSGVGAIERRSSGWSLQAGSTDVRAGTIVNASGAWGDVIAEMAGIPPLGLQPLRRSAATIPAPTGMDVRAWPMTIDLDESFYFKPDAGALLVSPADATLSEPMDAWCDDMDLAEGLDRITQMTTLTIDRVTSSWAGLRTFAPDHDPVIGFDPAEPSFFWSVGQGGYGIQTSPAWGKLAASLLLGSTISDSELDQMDPAPFSPARF